jgi:hypothetical protein
MQPSSRPTYCAAHSTAHFTTNHSTYRAALYSTI